MIGTGQTSLEIFRHFIGIGLRIKVFPFKRVFLGMKLIYRIGVHLARLILPIGGLFSPKLKLFLDGRKELFKNLAQFKNQSSAELAWFHVASLGEYEQAKPVIAKYKAQYPLTEIVVSFFSPSGYEHVIKKPQAHVAYITYLPLDTSGNAERFVKTLKPKIAFFVKYDLWFEHIAVLKSMNIPVFLFSASFRASQNYFKSDGFFRSILFQLDHIFTQNNTSLQLLEGINYTAASFAGDTRFDRVAETASNPKSFPEIAAWLADKRVLVAGSVWQEDMDLLIPLINENPHYRWIIAPHDLSVGPMERWAKEIQVTSRRYSQWDKKTGCDVLFIDNIGMLSSLYQFARLAYVGGAFGSGLHNILEPLGFGVPVIFGKLKNSQKFPEAQESQENACGFEVKDEEELKAKFKNLEFSEVYENSVGAAKAWVKSNQGAADRIITKVNQLLQ